MLPPLLALSASATELIGPFDVPTDTGTVGMAMVVPAAGEAPPYTDPDGFPVAVMFAGTFAADQLAITGCPLAEVGGFVLVYFLYPGAHGVGELCGHPVDMASTGTYRNRTGTDLVAAKDAVRFALGDLQTTAGETIQDLAGVDRPLHPRARGILALSDGNGAAAAMLRDHGADLGALGLRWLVSWEGLASDQVLTDELGRRLFDPDPMADSAVDADLEPDNEGWNPRWRATRYSYATLPMSYASVRWDPAYAQLRWDLGGVAASVEPTSGILFFDGDGDGVYGAPPRRTYGTTDADGNGHIGLHEDWGLIGHTVWDADSASLRTYLSVPLTEWIEANDPFGAAGWPSYLAHSAEAAAFWSDADPRANFPLITAPNLKTISAFAATHHGVTTRGHVETLLELEGLAAAGAWVRANPDDSYVAWAYGRVGEVVPAGVPETPAGVVPPVLAMDGAAEPAAIDDDLLTLAACRELTDRVHFGCWDADLSQVLEPGVPCP